MENHAKVKHLSLGEGTVTKRYGDKIEILFGEQMRRFKFPEAFLSGIMTTCDEELLESIGISPDRKGTGDLEVLDATTAVAAEPRVAIGSSSVLHHINNDLDTNIISDRCKPIDFKDDNDLFEAIGYLANPKRDCNIWAEIPDDERSDEFRRCYPGQEYKPITMGETSSGKPNKFSSQLRIFLGNINNCPNSLAGNLGKGLGSSVVARINNSKFTLQLVHFFGFIFGKTQNIKRIRDIAEHYGHLADFEKGYKR